MYIIEHGKVAVLLPKGGRRLSFTGNIRDGMSLSAETQQKERLGWRSELKRMEWRAKGETFVKQLKLGDFFGEETILKEEHATSVRALTYCDLLVLSDKHLEEVVEDFRSLATAIAKTLEYRENERASIDKHERRRLKQRRTSRQNSFTGLIDTNSGIDMGAAAARAAAAVAAAQMQGGSSSRKQQNHTTSMSADVAAAIAAASAAASATIDSSGRGGKDTRNNTCSSGSGNRMGQQRGQRAPTRKLSFVNSGEHASGGGDMQAAAAAAAAAAVAAAQSAMRSGSGLVLSPKSDIKKKTSKYAVQPSATTSQSNTPLGDDSSNVTPLELSSANATVMVEMLARQESVETMVRQMDDRMVRMESLLTKLLNTMNNNGGGGTTSGSPNNMQIRGSLRHSPAKSEDDATMDQILADVQSSQEGGSPNRLSSL